MGVGRWTGDAARAVLVLSLAVVFTGAAGAELTVEWSWADNPSGGSDQARSIAVDTSGSLYVAGYDFVSGNLQWRVVKLLPNGTRAWTWTDNPSSGGDRAYSIAVDSSSNLYVAGYASGQWRVVKLLPDGTQAWIWTDPSSSGEPLAIAVDAQSNIYAAGYDSAGGWQWRVVKLYPNGTQAWNLTQNPSSGHDVAYSIAVDSSGNLYVAGDDSSLGFGNRQWRVVKFYPNGTQVWSWIQNPSGNDDEAYSIAVDSSGSLYVAGYDGAPGNLQWRVVKLNPDRALAWSWTANPSSGSDVAGSIAVDSSGSLYVAGIDYGLAGDWRWQVVKLYPAGTQAWNLTQNPSGGIDEAYSIAADSSGSLYVAGYDRAPGNDQWRVVKLRPPPPSPCDSGAIVNGCFETGSTVPWTGSTTINQGGEVHVETHARAATDPGAGNHVLHARFGGQSGGHTTHYIIQNVSSAGITADSNITLSFYNKNDVGSCGSDCWRGTGVSLYYKRADGTTGSVAWWRGWWCDWSSCPGFGWGPDLGPEGTFVLNVSDKIPVADRNSGTRITEIHLGHAYKSYGSSSTAKLEVFWDDIRLTATAPEPAPPPPPPSSCTTLLSDDFNDLNINGWTVAYGSWSAAGGYAQAQTKYSENNMRQFYTPQTASSLTVEFDAALDATTCQAMSVGAYNTTSGTAIGGKLEAGCGAEPRGLFLWTPLQRSIGSWSGDTGWHHFKIAYANSSASLDVDGQRVASNIPAPATFEFDSVHVGGWNPQWSGVVGQKVDNIRVEACAAPAPGPSPSPNTTSSGWSSDIRLTYNDSHSSTDGGNNLVGPSVAVSGNSIHVVWYDFRDGQAEVYYKQSTDNGATWSADRRLTTGAVATASTSLAPSIAVDRQVVHVVWEDRRDGNNELYYKRSQDGGLTWGPDVRLTQRSYDSLYPRITVDGGVVHVVHLDIVASNPEVFYLRSSDGGTTWSETQITSGSSGSNWAGRPSLAISGNKVHLVWNQGVGSVAYRRSTNGGVTWDAAQTIGSGKGAMEEADVKAYGDEVHAVWYDRRDSTSTWGGPAEVYYARSKDGGTTWGNNTRLTYAQADVRWPRLAVDRSNVHLVWMNYSASEIFYKNSLDGGDTWGSDTRLTFDSAQSWYPSIALNCENLHVVWWDTRDGNSEIYYKNRPGASCPEATPPGMGRLVATSAPTDAAVSVDGTYIGQTPATSGTSLNVTLSTGKHTILMTKPGFVNCVQTVDIQADRANPVHCNFHMKVTPQVSGSDLVLSWPAVSNAAYHVHKTANKFGWNLSNYTEVSGTSATLAGEAADGDTEYFLIRTVDPTRGEMKSQVAFKTVRNFTYLPDKTNLHWVSVPYGSRFTKASDIVAAIEPEGGNSKISMVAKWDPSGQTTVGYGYFPGFGWLGDDFTLSPGDGVYLYLSGNSPSFSWSLVDAEQNSSRSFTYHADKTNLHWISVPYAGKYGKASDVVADIEPEGGNSRISMLAKWDASGQTTVGYGYFPGFGWLGDDFTINPGDGVYLYLSGNTPEFAWVPELAIG